MKPRIGWRLHAFFVVLCAQTVLFSAGCATQDKLTEGNFKQIRVQSATESDVQKLIGEPSNRLPGLWTFERPDKHLTAMVDFDETGRVTRVQWIDALGERWEDSDQPAKRP